MSKGKEKLEENRRNAESEMKKGNKYFNKQETCLQKWMQNSDLDYSGDDTYCSYCGVGKAGR